MNVVPCRTAATRPKHANKCSRYGEVLKGEHFAICYTSSESERGSGATGKDGLSATRAPIRNVTPTIGTRYGTKRARAGINE